MNHRPADRLIETYDRHTYADEQRAAMELWAGKVRDIVTPSPDNKITFPQLSQAAC